ncbi:hypothetical protein G9464_00910 [Halostella sp. JP-L12]|uniref:hypothetical protein n=1 Tax=Halostella TaxID=1843185 RepID=UPI000EF7F019|nr:MULTISPECIES: hypothetical protein [Halostella]NHN46159.1 hypothetical protein [Halostella sp. JP-L12]
MANPRAEFDEGPRYGRPQHDSPDETRDAELYGRPQHRETDGRGFDPSESPVGRRWAGTE